jgi:1-acyl-sn-glycerol-3-phosphate acyltransferase
MSEGKTEELAGAEALGEPRHASWLGILLVRAVCAVLFGIFYRLQIRGKENIPAGGPVIIAPNHVSYLDPLLAGYGVPIRRRVRSMAWDALFRIPVQGTMMRWLGAFPVAPGSADANAYKQCLRILQRGEALQIFPEGKRGEGIELEPFEAGAARMALKTGAPIVPVTITGAFEAWPKWQKWPRPHWPITVTYHKPIDPPKGPLRGAEMRSAIEVLTAQAREPINEHYQAYIKAQTDKGRLLPAPPDKA